MLSDFLWAAVAVLFLWQYVLHNQQKEGFCHMATLQEQLEELKTGHASLRSDVEAERAEVSARVGAAEAKIAELLLKIEELNNQTPDVDLSPLIADVEALRDEVKNINVNPETPPDEEEPTDGEQPA
jgi:outer membrane murein-binding lipoprotein Lpp